MNVARSHSHGIEQKLRDYDANIDVLICIGVGVKCCGSAVLTGRFNYI